MSAMKFNITYEIDEEGKYVIESPEFPDCFSKGNALEETIEALVSSLVKDKSGNSLNVMKINDKTPLAPPYIRTPNLETDIQDLFFPDLSIEEFKTIYISTLHIWWARRDMRCALG